MKLSRIRVEQLRRFRQPVEFRDLQPGINLFTGPNESGKSTLVRAIRAAFFERYKSNSVEDLQPWGDTSAAPAVELEFDWQGQHWTLSKRFLRQKRCDLVIDGRHLSGEEAEETLARWLGFEFSGRGASRPEHWGIPGLLWIEQGTGQDLATPAAHAGDYLRSALGDGLGEVASSAGDALIERVAAERALLLTETGRPTKALAAALKDEEALRARLEALDQAIAAYRQDVDQLGEWCAQREQDEASRPWEGYRAQGREAEARLAEVRDWQQAQQREEEALRDCRAGLQLLRERLAVFERQRAELGQRERGRLQAEQALDALQPRRAGGLARQQEAQAAWQAAEQGLRQARLQEKRAALTRERAQLAQELADLDERLAQARALQAERLALRGRIQGLRVDEISLKALRALDQKRVRLELARDAVATRLAFDLQPGQSLRLGGDTLAGAGERLLLEPAELRIEGVGVLRIRPGGEDLADRARSCQAAQEELEAALAERQVASLEDAEARLEERRGLEADLRDRESRLAVLAPQGVDELAGRQALGLQRQQALQAEWDRLSLPDSGSGGESGAEPVSVAQAESELEAAHAKLRAADQQVNDLDTELRLADQALQAARAEWRKLHETLHSAGHQREESALQSQLVDLNARESTLQQSLARRGQQIEHARPEILAQDIERYRRTADALETTWRQRATQIAILQARLETAGALGQEEERAGLAPELDAAVRRRAELQRRADALDFLLERLRARRQAVVQKIQAPLQRHLAHYLQLLFPQARLDVNEALIPEALVRPGSGQEAHDALEALSFGAREQVGLITRLAYADLLQEAGKPTLLILDDALVHSDPQRLAQMKRILFDAAQRHQILLFTCHPDNWRDLGVVALPI